MAKSRANQGAETASLVLAVLEQKPLHGYGIAREIERRSQDLLRLGEGTLYPALRDLEQSGFISGSWETSGPGAARKVYGLTDEGVNELRRARLRWSEYSRSVDQVLETQIKSIFGRVLERGRTGASK